MPLLRFLPNILTSVRLIVLPVFFIGGFIDSAFLRFILLVIYIFSAVTDFLDGYIARKFNVVSNFGRIFDPVADKALVIITLLMVIVRDTYLASVLFIPFTLILVRELLISGLREGLSGQDVSIKVSFLSKFKTAFQMIAIGFLIAGNKLFPSLHADIIGVILLWIAVVITLLTGADYIIKNRKHLSS